ncbi:MAG: FliM/FliN family flagellar motor switch protein [Deltaproteobacteria bacterium]|nr:FliM/FliN family flagellar motor switch protein [Deltaproteobacteria bacterium]MBI2500723.1 FliM/FliN family flagellar motor switch protein [Deltaproteobacteria bacterium]MBI4196684.1 FliM/FliN family flagellar motor switch protein [Deltaproteobacteria bacterium]
MKEKDPYLSELDALDTDHQFPSDEEATDVQMGQPPPFSEEGAEGPIEEAPHESVSLASDVPVQLVVVLGRKEVTVKDLVDFKKGQVVELNKVANEAVDLVAGGKVIAKGELVEIEGKLGVRILKMLK